MNTLSELSETFAALANPTRLAILETLAHGDATVKELAAPFDMSLPAVSKHIKVLERAGLITQGQKAQFRPCTLNPEPIRALASWTEAYRPIWETRFNQMDTLLKQIEEPKNGQ